MQKEEKDRKRGKIRELEILKETSISEWNKKNSEDFRRITGIVYDLRAVLTSDGLYPHSLAVSVQEKRIESMKRSDLIQAQKDLSISENRIKSKKKKLNRKQQELKEIAASCDKKKQKLQKEQRRYDKLEADLRVAEDEIKKLREKMNNVTLVHKSVTPEQKISQNEKIFITELDSKEIFEFNRFCVDGIFEEKDAEGFITKLPYSFYGIDEKEQKSILLFCEMVTYFMMSGGYNVKTIFRNKVISDVLKMNGL